MAEPVHSTTLAGVAVATGTVTLGTIMGLQADALLFGLFGGLVTMLLMGPIAAPAWLLQGLGVRAATIVMLGATLGIAAFLAGVFSPVVVPVALDHLPGLAKVPAESLRLAASSAIGIVSQVLLPVLLRLIERRGGAA